DPQFTWISIIEDGSEGITMELEMQWDGNPSIILDIKTYVGVALPVQVKNIGFTGIFKLIFRPLVDEFPCFRAQFLAFLMQLREPSRTLFKTLSCGQYEKLFPFYLGIIFVVEDPLTQHLVVKIYDDKGHQSAELIGCAHIFLNELEPGKVKDIWLKLVKDLEIKRDKKNRVQVHLELLYCPNRMNNGLSKLFSQNESMTSLERVLKNSAEEKEVSPNGSEINNRREVIVRGVISVTVVSGNDLPPADIGGKADPYVVLIMKKAQIKSKTRVVNESLNPVWNKTFDFVVEDGLHDMLMLEVWDHDTFGKDFMGKCILTLKRVLIEGEYKDSYELAEVKSGKLNLHLKWNPQPIYRDYQ
ncbi:hypothetical protein MTR67_048363, partial [Solanum verrucosum]